jgi:peptidoglycan/LPS O-acetylase OafA/YrhL
VNDKIDVCRGLFAFLVVVAHAHEVAWSMHPDVPNRLGWASRQVLASAAGSGIYWVMGFFVISGYCIQLSVQRLADQGSFSLGTYLVARLTRIIPLYYVALLFTVTVEWWIAADRPGNWPNGLNLPTLLCQLLLIQNLTQTFGSFAPSWSITNEAFYYVFYGLLVVALARGSRRPAFVGIALCLVVGACTQIPYRLGLRSPAILSTGMLFGLGINWFLGALVAEHRDWLRRDPQVQAIARWWPAILALPIGLRCTDRIGMECVWMGSGLAFTLMLIRFLGRDWERAGPDRAGGPSPRSRRLITALGLASYPTYLFHGPILMLVGSTVIRWDLAVDWRWTWAVLTSAGIASGIVLGYLLEQPIMAWRATLLRRLGSARARPITAGGVQVGIAGVGN